MIAGMVMSLALIGSAMPMTASAVYDNCDVNRDGDVSLADLIYVTQYLNGGFSISNYNQLDVNKSLTVDAADEECLTARLTGSTYQACYYSRANERDNDPTTYPEISFPNVSGFTPDAYASSTAGREYRRYSYIEHKELEPYTLTPTIGNLSSGVNSRGVVSVDDRYRAYGIENTGIVRVGTATGFIVDNHHIATAAHCVYLSGIWLERTVRLYNADGTVSDTLKPVEIHIPSSFDTPNDVYDDYALITVNEDLSDPKYNCTFFSLANSYNITVADYANVPIYVTGSPSSVTGIDNLVAGNLYSAEGRVKYNTYNGIMYYNVYATSGNSGGPVYTITQNTVNGEPYYTYSALAINTGTYEEDKTRAGSLITKYHLQFYHNNPNANYVIEN